MNDKPDGLLSVGWVLFGVGLLAGVWAFSSSDGTGVQDLMAGAIVATPLTISGSVLAAAGHLLRRR